jgi:hypothetical protein
VSGGEFRKGKSLETPMNADITPMNADNPDEG